MRVIKNEAEKPIMRHFSDHSIDNVRFAVLQCLGKEGKAYRQLIKERWIVRLGTKFLTGCTVQMGF